MMIAIESEGLFRTFMEFNFCFIPASLSCFARYFYAFLFLWTAGMLSAMLRKGTAGVCASLLEEV